MAIIYNKDEKTATDNVSGASLVLIKSRREETEYLFKTSSEAFYLGMAYSFEGRGPDNRSLIPKRKNIRITSLQRLSDWDGDISYKHILEILRLENAESVDYRAYKAEIEALVLVHQTRGAIDGPTEIIIDFSSLKNYQNKNRGRLI